MQQDRVESEERGIIKVIALLVSLHNLDFLIIQPIQLIHQLVNLPVGRLNLALQYRPSLGHAFTGQALVQAQHLLDQADHLVVPGFVGGVGEVNGSDGDLLHILKSLCTIKIEYQQVTCTLARCQR